MSVDQACKKKALQYVNAVEIRNGKVTVQDNEMARKVAERLELPGTGGSDAHNLDDIGTYVTVFEQDIQDDRQLVAALHGGIFTIGEGRIS